MKVLATVFVLFWSQVLDPQGFSTLSTFAVSAGIHCPVLRFTSSPLGMPSCSPLSPFSSLLPVLQTCRPRATVSGAPPRRAWGRGPTRLTPCCSPENKQGALGSKYLGSRFQKEVGEKGQQMLKSRGELAQGSDNVPGRPLAHWHPSGLRLGVPLAGQWPEAVSLEAELAGTAYLVRC